MANDLRLRVLFDMIDNATRPLRNMMNGSRQTTTAMRETRDRLRQLQATQRDVSAFRELRTGMAATATQMNQARARVAQLASEIAATGAPTREMARQFEEAKTAAARLRAETRQQHIDLHQLRGRLSGAGIDTRNLGQHERSLRQDIDQTNEALQRQQAELARVAANERRLAQARARRDAAQARAGRMAGTGAAATAAGTVTGAALSVPVQEYAKAEDSATQLRVSLMRAGAEVPPEFQKINDLATRLGDKLPGTTSDFQDMMTMLNRQGISTQSILGGMGEATAYLGVLLKKAPDDAAEFSAKLQDATRTSEKDMLSLMDVIQRTFYLGVDDNNMLQGFAKLSPAMDAIKQKGLEGAKVLAPLLVMADQAGMAGEASGNAFRKIFQLSLDSKKVGKANKGLAPGQQLDFTDGKGEFGGLDKMFKQLDKLKGLSTQKRLGVLKEIYGDDAETLQAIALMMEKGVAGYREVQGKMGAQASLQERVNVQLGTLKNLWDATKGTATNALVAFGASIAPELKATTEWLGEMAQRVGAWARENPRLAAGLMKAGALLALLLIVGGALLLMLASVLGPLAMVRFALTTLGIQGTLGARALGLLTGAFRLVSSAVLLLGRALLMNPIGLAITAIAAGAYFIYRNWEPITRFFAGIWNEIRTASAGGLASVLTLLLNWSPIGAFYKAFAAVLSWFGIELPSKFTTFGANIMAGLVSGITGALGTVRDAIGGAADATINWFKAKLGIHSPSRVFSDLGGFISQGAAQGVEGEQGKLTRAAANLASAAALTFAGAGAAPAAPLATGSSTGSLSIGGDTITITIQADAGAGADAIARAVRAELDKRDQAKRARFGSRLTD
jgi:TP901 family phage tail tape measure protein